jgi:hypothetical protein
MRSEIDQASKILKTWGVSVSQCSTILELPKSNRISNQANAEMLHFDKTEATLNNAKTILQINHNLPFCGMSPLKLRSTEKMDSRSYLR